MTDFDKRIKDSLNNTAFKKARFTEKQKMNIRYRIHSRNYNTKTYPKFLTTVAVLLLLFLIGQMSVTVLKDDLSSALKNSETTPTLKEINLEGEIRNLQKEIEILENENHELFGYVYRFEDPFTNVELVHKGKVGEDYFLLLNNEDGLQINVKQKGNGEFYSFPLWDTYQPIEGFQWYGGRHPEEHTYYGVISNDSVSSVQVRMDSIEQEITIIESSTGERIWFSIFPDEPKSTKDNQRDISIEVHDQNGDIIWMDNFKPGY
ncbi:hypothetical protein [Halalkalibacter okhensis]|uniref:Uncharacterized protein n=1 Tax=Halalkalibacter okhensis TaxID=333138 RepID=A0A0B0I7U6_9BACI|nr:hypothetical protein [Halalkalibacter okhensis]KHF38558.1 hypothetical protein LQ50_20645 [Halalkalibacter okhensis]